MRVVIDQGRCCSAGSCVLAAPKVFDQREEDGVVVVLDESPPEELRPDVERAVQLCPVAAIRLEK